MPRRRSLILVTSALALSGCVAAAIPVVAGGAVARSAARDEAKPRAAERRPTEPPAPARDPVAAAPAPEPLPSDVGAVRPGQLYAGSLPPPGPALAPPPQPAPQPAPLRADATPERSTWSDVGHHIAADPSPERSVLLARGSDAADPRWVACAGKPAAVLAAASTVLGAGIAPARELDAAARSWLGALRVLDVKAVLIAADRAEGATVAAAFEKAGLPALAQGDTLILASAPAQMPAVRADVGARYCVTALVGRAAADFPNGLTPATTPEPLRSRWGKGWFLIAGPAG